MKILQKNLYSNGKLYLSKDLKKILKADVGDKLGVYKSGEKIIVEKFQNLCLRCHDEILDDTDEGAVCYKCKLKTEDRLAIVDGGYTISTIPAVNLVNIPEPIRTSLGFIVNRDDKNKYKNRKFPIEITGMPNKKRLIIKKIKTAD